MAGQFNHRSTADEVLDGINLAGKRALVTGGASGIGVETVRALASKGAEVVIAARNVEQAEAAKKSIAASTGNHSIRIVTLDLASLAKVESAANECLQRFDRLDFLINNAGVMACPFAQTEEGLELQFGSNHIGHFYFTKCLMPLLLAGAPSRVISLTSMAHRMSPVVFDDIQYATRAYDKWQAYGQSKTANALFAVALNARFSGRGVEAFSVHPGAIATPLGRHLAAEEIEQLIKDNARSATNPEDAEQGGIKTVAQGAATSVFAATAAELSGKGGAYLENCGIAEVVPNDPTFRGGVRNYAVDVEQADRLWNVSESLVSQILGR